MMNQNATPQPAQRPEQRMHIPAKPNESGRLDVQDHVRIYDPNTQETLLEKRA